jgi:hypothetical protein
MMVSNPWWVTAGKLICLVEERLLCEKRRGQVGQRGQRRLTDGTVVHHDSVYRDMVEQASAGGKHGWGGDDDDAVS